MESQDKTGGPSPPTNADETVPKATELIAPEQKPLPATFGQCPLDRSLDPSSFPHTKMGREGPIPLATLQNTEHLLTGYGIRTRYNVMAKRLEMVIPGLSGTSENFQNVAINTLISLGTLNGMPTGNIPNYVSVIAEKHLYNPVADWIKSNPWDGKDRLPAVYATLVVKESFPEKLKVQLIYRWLLSCVAAVLTPSGFTARGVLTLQGPQGIGKTSWFRSLITNPLLRDEAILCGHHLDPSQKDSVVTAISHWIVEIGELDSSFKKDIARLKGFITGEKDKVRRPYARGDSEYQRRTVFCATVNEVNFLVDPTGNSRWWTLPVIDIDYQHSIDMQQVFAQLALDFEKGEKWWLPGALELALDAQNKNHRAVSSLEEKLLGTFDKDLPTGEWSNHSATEVLQHIGYERPTNPQCRECGRFLREHYGEPKKIQGIYKWRVPIKDSRW